MLVLGYIIRVMEIGKWECIRIHMYVLIIEAKK
jgi:hypothetical protein